MLDSRARPALGLRVHWTGAAGAVAGLTSNGRAHDETGDACFPVAVPGACVRACWRAGGEYGLFRFGFVSELYGCERQFVLRAALRPHDADVGAQRAPGS